MFGLKLTRSQWTEVKRDALVFVGALLATGILDGGHPTRATITAALVTALKVTARGIFPHGDDPPPPPEDDELGL